MNQDLPPSPIGGMPLPHIIDAMSGYEANTAPSDEAERHAAVAFIVRQRPAGGAETLFIKRTERPDDPWSGHMALPGGRREAGDESLEATARRETLEEVGLELEPAQCFGRLHDIYGGRLHTFKMSVSPFLYQTADGDNLTHNKDEVADAVWVPLSLLSDPKQIRDYMFHLDPHNRPFPSFHYNDYVIWGLTFRIIANFMEPFGVTLPGEPGVTDVE